MEVDGQMAFSGNVLESYTIQETGRDAYLLVIRGQTNGAGTRPALRVNGDSTTNYEYVEIDGTATTGATGCLLTRSGAADGWFEIVVRVDTAVDTVAPIYFQAERRYSQNRGLEYAKFVNDITPITSFEVVDTDGSGMTNGSITVLGVDEL